MSWLSGTASWAHYTATQHILGLRPEAGGLRIDPCIPHEWSGFTAKRRFRDNMIHVEVRNPVNINRGVSHLVVNGVRMEGGVLPLSALRKLTRAVAVLGH